MHSLFTQLPDQRRPLKQLAKPPASNWRPPAAYPRLKGRKRISVDLETKDPRLKELGPGDVRRDGFIAGIGLAIDDGPRMYFPIRHEGGDNLDETMTLRWLKAEAAEYDGQVFGAKLIYDLCHLAAYGIEFSNVKPADFYDVQVAEVLLDEWRYAYDLDSISRDYLGVGKEMVILNEIAQQYSWKTDDAIKANLWRLPARYVGPYAEGDVDRPLRIYPLQEPRLISEDLTQVWEIERSLTPILLGMRRRGVRVDVKRAEEVRAILTKKLEEQVSILRSFAGPKAELTEVASWVHALKETGLPLAYTEPSEKFPQGQISTAKPWLEKHQKHPMISAIMLGRKFFTARNTFIDGHVFTHSIRGRIHAEFNQLKNDDGRGTAARFSCSNPNLQNITARDEELAPLIRGIFLPDEGEDWQRDDYSQIEYRLLAHFAVGRGANEVRQTYCDDPKTDYHKLCATMLDVDPENKIKRKRVKNTNFAKGYGAQVPKLAETFGCSIEEAEKFVREYEEKLPFTVDTFQAAMRWAAKRGFVVSVLNRRARFPLWVPIGTKGKARKKIRPLPREQALAEWGPGIERANTYTALNNKLQFSSADITKKGMVDAHRAGVYRPTGLGFPLVTVHDESGASKPRTAEGQEAGRELTRIMERAVTLRVPVIVESDTGPSWGACS